MMVMKRVRMLRRMRMLKMNMVKHLAVAYVCNYL